MSFGCLKKLDNVTDFLEIAVTEMIYVDRNQNCRMQQYSAKVAPSAVGISWREDRETEWLTDGLSERETDEQRKR